MTPDSNPRIDQECRNIYAEIDRVWLAHKGKFPTWHLGYAILFSPPRYRPDLVIVGDHPSAFFATEYPQSYDPLWPSKNEMVTESYPFAAKMQRLFSSVGALGVLANSVQLNLNAFRSRPANAQDVGFRWRDNPPEIRKALEKASFNAAMAMLDLMRPKLVLATGLAVFDRLASSEVDLVPRRSGQRRCVKGNSGAHTVLGIPNPTGAYVSVDDWAAIMECVRANIG